MLKFDTKFIPQGDDTAAFAKALKKALNSFTKRGWEVGPMQFQAPTATSKGGVLIIATKQVTTVMELLAAHMAQQGLVMVGMRPGSPGERAGGPPPEEHDRMTREDESFIDEVMGRVRSGPKDQVLKQIGEVIPAIAKTAPNDVLAQRLAGLRKYAEAHSKAHVGREPCDLLIIVNEIVKHLAPAVQLGVN